MQWLCTLVTTRQQLLLILVSIRITLGAEETHVVYFVWQMAIGVLQYRHVKVIIKFETCNCVITVLFLNGVLSFTVAF